ncbi:YXWGXW repeat-containing protein [Edaphobacter aggregans]|uniref:YXWGXW repeat-containing protein n=1 Tax=Edaphobacter aggregans TaxID=570835 RepID=UPI000A004B58|nr:YXWGXW repeat-containing protein [Edaphobacter aggregans]
MNARWVLGSILAASTLTAPAFSQVSIGVTIGTPPPPIQYEAPPPIPAVGYVWTPGYWAPYGGHYAWRRGYWARPPYEGAPWRPARWVHEGPGWRYYEGGWGPREFHGPPPREFHGPPGHAYGHYKDHGHHEDHDHGHGHHDHD